ncbi:MAG: DUF4326 domain-containing protein [Clostridiaceae bacterium]|nr:DUF4326 domain-containing protein [Clostridiaceae bacterium]
MPVRIQRKRVKGWEMPESAIYVGRPTKWGNPFRVGQISRPVPRPEITHDIIICAANGSRMKHFIPPIELAPFPRPLTAEDMLEQYRAHILAALGLETIRVKLGGKDLACWCRPDQPCHAEVLLEIANAERGSDA